ncbi:MAG: hypothetical protein HOM14_06005 [Gammaproteobacteria bacterium]|jgi:cell shape-determining protein MreC|nr:hypothetical protein [Gammaproteobacteria bacterium]MBT3721986.1 hypothetical protein [Gammaproteobacteria bacterium]MBT4077778.1 hypothetical protein [Gammaproteobacteria bacterium]MBT4196791.1 hypothetical protein [Gammaproteobacteria bacterium]MBT4449110.1 hypothetical protein [Gammaproteobacteria bacterium]
MFGIFQDHLEKKRKEAHELELKKALSLKFSNYDKKHFSSINKNPDNTDYTEITIHGSRMRVKKEHITIVDISPERLAMNH